MAWDSRGYYYQSKRINGQPRRVYVGAGFLAELTAREDAAEQAQKAAQDAQRRLQKAQDRAILKDIDAQYRELRAFVWALLTAAGYRQYKNREWRKMGKRAAAQLTGPVDEGAPVDVEALVARINSQTPRPADLDALRRVLAAPDANGDRTGTPTALSGAAVLDGLLTKRAGNAAERLIMLADAKRMEKTLGRDSAPPFERPLIDHVVLCWARLQLVEIGVSNNTSGAHNREDGAYWDRRLTEAQRRYLRAVNLLAKVRHMGPAVQVNIANQQVVQNNGK